MDRDSSEDGRRPSQSLLRDEEKSIEFERPLAVSRRFQWTLCAHWIIHIITLLSVLGLYLVYDGSLPSRDPFDLYTPARTALGDDRRVVKFQASFWQETPYKGPATPEVIKAWDHITNTPALNLTKEEIQGMGLSTDSVQYPEQYGGGYLAYLESAHLLHCLEALWEDHHYQRRPELFPLLKQKLEELPDIMEHHFEHCVDVLRQQLMCNANSGVVTFRWVEDISGPYPEFSSKHVCHDYESLLEWSETRKASHDGLYGHDWKPPAEGVVKLAKAP